MTRLNYLREYNIQWCQIFIEQGMTEFCHIFVFFFSDPQALHQPPLLICSYYPKQFKESHRVKVAV